MRFPAFSLALASKQKAKRKAKMTIMEAFAALRAKYPEGGLNINPNFWFYGPGEYRVQWSVYIHQTNELFQAPTLEGALAKALEGEGDPFLSAVQCETAVKEMASV